MTLAALRLRTAGLRTVTLRPGDRLTIGRHAHNGLVVLNPSVSRFHARVSWAPDARRPVVHDLGSANGTFVDGRAVREPTSLGDGSVLAIGDVTLVAELDENVDPSLIESQEGAVGVRLYDEHGPERSGVVSTREALVALLMDLELDRRTGTLFLERGPRRARVTFARGRIAHAATDARTGPGALRELLERDGMRYTFRTDVEPHESAMWISFRSWLEAQEQATSRVPARHRRALAG